jgi:hypothetical protein
MALTGLLIMTFKLFKLHTDYIYGLFSRTNCKTQIFSTKWYSNKHFRGSYSFKSIGSVKANVGADDLAAPLLVNDKPVSKQLFRKCIERLNAFNYPVFRVF